MLKLAITAHAALIIINLLAGMVGVATGAWFLATFNFAAAGFLMTIIRT